MFGQLSLSGLQNKARSWFDSIWRLRYFGWATISGFALWYLFWAYHIPSPSKAATLLAVIAAFMTFRGELAGAEKFFWVIILFSFLFMELRAIDNKEENDETARRVARTEEAKAFGKIGAGIETAIAQSERQFHETVSQQSEHFDATMTKEQMNTDEVTGGKSYVIVFPDLTPNKINTFPLQVMVCGACQYTVPDAYVSFQENPFSGESGPTIFHGAVNNFPVYTGSTITPDVKDGNTYKILVLARNKPTREILKVRFNPQSGKWECSWHIEREVKRAHYNAETKMAEGEVMKILEDSGWSSNSATPINPERTTVIH